MSDETYWADNVEPIFNKAVKKKDACKYAIFIGSKKKASATDYKIDDSVTAWTDIVEYIDFNIDRGESYFMIHIVTGNKDRYPFEIPVGKKPQRRGASLNGTQYMTGGGGMGMGMGVGGKSMFEMLLSLTSDNQALQSQMLLEKTTSQINAQMGQLQSTVNELKNSTMFDRMMQNPMVAPKVLNYADRFINFCEKKLLPEDTNQQAKVGANNNTTTTTGQQASNTTNQTNNPAPAPAATPTEDPKILKDKKAAFNAWNNFQKLGINNGGSMMEGLSMMYMKDEEKTKAIMQEAFQKLMKETTA